MISIIGDDAAIARFFAWAGLTEVAGKESEQRAAEPVLRSAQERVAVDTGALKGTLRIEEREGHAAVVAGDDTVDYAIYVEFNPDNEPFLRPAADDAHDEAVSEVSTVIAAVIR